MASIFGVMVRSTYSLTTSKPPSRYRAAVIDSYTAAASELGICSRELIPLPVISRSVSPVSFETSAHVRRETTADLILVRSPSRYSGKRRYSASDDQVQHRVAEE